MGRSKKPIKVNLKKLVDKVNKNPLNKNLGVKLIDTDVKDINDSFEIQEKTKLKNTNYGPAVVYQDNEKKGMKTMFGKRYPNCVKKSKKKK